MAIKRVPHSIILRCSTRTPLLPSNNSSATSAIRTISSTSLLKRVSRRSAAAAAGKPTPEDAEIPSQEQIEATRKIAENAENFAAQTAAIFGTAAAAAAGNPGPSASTAPLKRDAATKDAPSIARMPINLRSLIHGPNKKRPIPSPRLMDKAVEAAAVASPNYPVNETTARHLTAAISSHLNALLREFVVGIPSVREGIIVLACPMKGSDIYLEQLTYTIADGLGAEFRTVRNRDIYRRLSGLEVVTSGPVADGRESTPSRKGRRPSSQVVQMVIPFGGGNLAMAPADEGNDVREDTPSVPYPWFKDYIDARGEKLVLPRARSNAQEPNLEEHILLCEGIDHLFSQLKAKTPQPQPLVLFYADFMELIGEDEARTAHLVARVAKHLDDLRQSGRQVAFVVPHTTTFVRPATHAGGISSVGDMMRALQSNAKEDETGPDDDDGDNGLQSLLGGNRPKAKGPNYTTPLDKYIGATRVEVLPPTGAEFKKLESMCESDVRKIMWHKNMYELEIAAQAAGIALDLNRSELEEIVTSTNRDSGRDVSTFSTRVLSPTEIEHAVMLMVAEAGRSSSASLIAESMGTISLDDFLAGADVFSRNAHTLEDLKGGLEFANVFKNPLDRARLTRREIRILHQCLVKSQGQGAGFELVGGLARTKQTLQELIQLPLQMPQYFSKGILSESTTGVLLFGPPGTGKTMLAKAVAEQCGANFLHVQMSSLQNAFVGETEKFIKALFDVARKAAPCVIFVDEIDALLKARQRHSPQYATSTVTEFLQQWDGMASEAAGVIVVGATNRPFDLDEAVLRRLPRRILVDLPDSEERKEIISIKLRDNFIGETNSPEERQQLVDKIAGLTEGYSGSDLKNACITAAMVSLRAHLQKPTDAKTITMPSISVDHFTKAFESGDVGPSLSDKAELVEQLKKWDKMYGTGAGGYGKGASGWGFDIAFGSKAATKSA